MKFNRKHLTTLVATLLLALPLSTANAATKSTSFIVDDLKYLVNNDGKTVTVTYLFSSPPRYVNIPSSISIPSSVSYNGISYTVTSIGHLAFEGVTKLNKVTIPTTVTSISTSSFAGCTGIVSFQVSSGNTIYDSRDNCNAIIITATNELLTGCKNTIIPNSVISIGVSAFFGCSGLTSVTIPNSVTTIGQQAFYSCSGLTSVTIPNSVTTIGQQAFYSCSGLTSVTIGNSVTSIGNSAFYKCSNLTSVTIPNSVTSIGNSAFAYCNNLTNIAIPNSVTSIGDYAFQYCSGLTSVTIPNSIISIGMAAFKNSGLTRVNITDLAAWCKIDFHDEYANPLNTAHHLFFNGNEITDLVLPNSVTTISKLAFYGNRLTSITIPSTITSIGNYAFGNYNGLRYVNCRASIPPTLGSNSLPSSIPIFIPTGTMSTYKNTDKWKYLNLRYSLTKITPYRTHATIVSEDKEISHLVKVKLNNKEYSVSNDSILIDGLQPRNYNEYENNHTAVAFCKVLGEDRVDTIQFRTMPLNFIEMSGSSTQSTITPKFKVDRADEHGIKISITSSGARYGYPSKDYSGRIIEETDDYYVIETAPITGLTPNSKIYYIPWVTCNGKRCEGPQYNITTQNIGTSSNAVTGPTNVEMTASYNAGDATVKDAYFTFNGQQMKKIVMTGLRPSTTYSTVYTVVTNNGKINTNMSFKTKSLTMTTQEARMLSDTSPMLIAETNMADVETSCGFEWRRYDAPEEMPSAKVYCPVYGGTMAGVLKNMSPNVYYKYRPFYKASDGSEYYGNWIAFITADAGVTFEPVVYTYKAPEVTQNTATLQGVALPGSSEITEQGFEYWRMNGSKAPTGTVNKVTATGQRMSATVQGLNAGATYGYRSYVKAGGQTYYGSEEQFTTEKPTGDVNGDSAVNVSDVTTLVNMILGVIPKDNTRADIDGNGTVNVSDVTALVNLILGIH